MAEWSREHGSNAVAIVTAGNSLFAVMTNLLLRAMRTIRRSERPYAFFTAEEEGRRWLEEMRRRDAHSTG